MISPDSKCHGTVFCLNNIQLDQPLQKDTALWVKNPITSECFVILPKMRAPHDNGGLCTVQELLNGDTCTFTPASGRAQATCWVYLFSTLINIDANVLLPEGIFLGEIQLAQELAYTTIQNDASGGWFGYIGAYLSRVPDYGISCQTRQTINPDTAFTEGLFMSSDLEKSSRNEVKEAPIVASPQRYPYKTLQTVINVLTVTVALACTITTAMLCLWSKGSVVTLMVVGAILAALIAILLGLNAHQLYHVVTTRIILSMLCKTVSLIMVGLLFGNMVPPVVGLGFTIACVVLTTTAGCLDHSASVLPTL
jgi:hypothetical protein